MPTSQTACCSLDCLENWYTVKNKGGEKMERENVVFFVMCGDIFTGNRMYDNGIPS